MKFSKNLRPNQLRTNPLLIIEAWYRVAVRKGVPLPDAVTLATASRSGRPHARTVLYKGQSGDGILFFTNYKSDKARDLKENPYAAMVFHWPLLNRQVRIEGPVIKATREESERYFATRPRGSQLGAWASPQSAVIGGRAGLEKKILSLKKKFQGRPIPCPPFWGGYKLIPTHVEFWVRGKFRLHDRYLFEKSQKGWKQSRLAP